MKKKAVVWGLYRYEEHCSFCTFSANDHRPFAIILARLVAIINPGELQPRYSCFGYMRSLFPFAGPKRTPK